jgi:hypothetical protein
MHMPPSVVSTNAKRPTTQACNPARPQHATHRMHQHRVGTSSPHTGTITIAGCWCSVRSVSFCFSRLTYAWVRTTKQCTAIQGPVLHSGVMHCRKKKHHNRLRSPNCSPPACLAIDKQFLHPATLSHSTANELWQDSCCSGSGACVSLAPSGWAPKSNPRQPGAQSNQVALPARSSTRYPTAPEPATATCQSRLRAHGRHAGATVNCHTAAPSRR